MVSHPETGLESPIGSDRDRGRDIAGALLVIVWDQEALGFIVRRTPLE